MTRAGQGTVWGVPGALAVATLVALVVTMPVVARAQDASETVAWQERFDRDNLGWVDPFDHPADLLARVYSVQHDGASSFLHARYDGTTPGHPPALDYGKAFKDHPVPLERVRALKWRWRVLHHPNVGADPWVDCAASVYVIIKVPSVMRGGTGFKFAWLAKPGTTGTFQHGLLQVPLRHDPAGPAWQDESVDLCGMYRKQYGACEGQHVLYVGVMTDGDGTQSLAEADYAAFQLLTGP